MSNRSKRGPKKKKKPAKKKTEKDKEKPPSLEIVKEGKDGEEALPPEPPKVRPLPPDIETEWLISEAKDDVLKQKKIVNGLEQQLLERDEIILGLRKEIVILRVSALQEEEAESHSRNKAFIASLDLKEGEAVLRIGGKLTIGPVSMVGPRPEGEKKSG